MVCTRLASLLAASGLIFLSGCSFCTSLTRNMPCGPTNCCAPSCCPSTCCAPTCCPDPCCNQVVASPSCVCSGAGCGVAGLLAGQSILPGTLYPGMGMIGPEFGGAMVGPNIMQPQIGPVQGPILPSPNGAITTPSAPQSPPRIVPVPQSDQAQPAPYTPSGKKRT